MAGAIAGGLVDDDWELLLQRIGRCTPFLGAGAAPARCRSAREIATQWAAEYDVSARRRGRPGPRRAVRRRHAEATRCSRRSSSSRSSQGSGPPDFRRRTSRTPRSPTLPLPVYMTTNYDDFMVGGAAPRAARIRGGRSAAGTAARRCRSSRRVLDDADGFVADAREPGRLPPARASRRARVARADRGRLPRLPRRTSRATHEAAAAPDPAGAGRHVAAVRRLPARATGTSACSTAGS